MAEACRTFWIPMGEGVKHSKEMLGKLTVNLIYGIKYLKSSVRGNVLWLPAKETFKRLLRSWSWGKICPQLNFRNRGRWSCSGDCFLSQVNTNFSGWCFMFKQIPVVERLMHESINSWWKQRNRTTNVSGQDIGLCVQKHHSQRD